MSDIRRLEDKVDKIQASVHNIDVTLAKQHSSLAEHMRRTQLLEQELKPVKKYISMSQGIIAFLGFVLAIVAAVSYFH